MPDNPQSPANDWFSLSDHRLISLEGRDAVAFAQSQTMNDVAALGDGHWQWNGWLTPKGRVIALFALIRLHTDTVWMLVPDADADDLAARLGRFVFRSKVAIRTRDDLAVSGRFRASDLASGAHVAGDAGSAIELDLTGDPAAGGRSLRIGPAARASTDPQALLAWRRADLEHGWPRLEPGQSEQWTPQQLSLERLRAYSVKKGCYPGQEIVARTHFLGQAKRGLALLHGDEPLAAGAELQTDGATIGTVVSACGDRALAVVPLESRAEARHDARSPAGGGASWRFLALREGLAR
jgi:folate-binding protein YgfZ